MTEDELNNAGQIVQKCLAPHTGWILVLVPLHRCRDDQPCPVQTVGNLDEGEAERVLEGAVAMYAEGTHEPMFTCAVEKTH
jgi:hypothetical protein